MKPLKPLIASVCIFTGLIAIAAYGGGELVVTKDNATTFYRSFKRLTKEPRHISPAFGAACRQPTQQAIDARNGSYGPHFAGALHTYANLAAADAITSNVAEFPVGAVIVKEKLKLGQRGRSYFSEVGGMIIRAKGYDPVNGDWEFFFYTLGGEFDTGKLANCIDCHSGGKRDHVFSLWSLSQQTVDPIGFKSASDAYTAPPLPNTSRSSADQNPTQVRSIRESLSAAWKQIQAIDHPLLATISDTKPSFDEDAQGIHGASIRFSKNAVWPLKGAGPEPIDSKQPFIWVQVDVWRKDQAAQPTRTTQSLRIGDTDYSLLILVLSSDPSLNSRVESTLFSAFGKTTTPAPSSPPK